MRFAKVNSAPHTCNLIDYMPSHIQCNNYDIVKELCVQLMIKVLLCYAFSQEICKSVL